jgi:outer membrane translocation and assembly module TamA
VRIFLNGGDDRAIIRGDASADIILRIIGGDGDDVVLDSIPGGDAALRVYDAVGNDRFESPRQSTIDRKPYVPPSTGLVQHTVRDWGTWLYMQRSVTYEPTIGVLASISGTRFTYGFRRYPFASRSTVRLDVSPSERRPRLTYNGTFHKMNATQLLNVQLMASGLELIRFHGLGNETRNDSSTSHYRVFQNLFRVEPMWVLEATPQTTFSLGAVGQYTTTRDDANTFVGVTRPYGSGPFGEVGARVGLEIDRRDVPNAARKGFRLAAHSTLYPAIWSVDRTFAEADMVASTYVSARGYLAPTLALRAGGQHVWGKFPYHNAAFLGGSRSLRGWNEQRFAGRSSLYGSAEVRLRLGRYSILVPADIGLIGFSDVGRVFVDSENSDEWHNSVGGGISIAPIARTHTVTLSVARGRERTGFYIRSGFAF